MPPYSSVFLRSRSIAFACITFLNLLWIILLCLAAFYHWRLAAGLEKSMLIFLLCTHTITVFLLPILALREFRPWLDFARFLFLKLMHFGGAIAFSIWYHKLECVGTPDEQGACHLFKIYILIALWATPLLLLIYMGCLGYMMYYRRSRGLDVESSPVKEDPMVQKKSSGSSEVMTKQKSNTSDSALSDSSTRDGSGWTPPESPFKSRFSTSTGQKSRVNSTEAPRHSTQAPRPDSSARWTMPESPFASRFSTSTGHKSRVNSTQGHVPHRSLQLS